MDIDTSVLYFDSRTFRLRAVDPAFAYSPGGANSAGSDFISWRCATRVLADKALTAPNHAHGNPLHGGTLANLA